VPLRLRLDAGAAGLRLGRLGVQHLPRLPGRGPHLVAPGVQQDREQPRPGPQGRDPLPVITGKRAEGAQERRGREVLGVRPPPADPQRGAEQHVLVRLEEGGKARVEVGRQLRRDAIGPGRCLVHV
jgi:hypothetical protein